MTLEEKIVASLKEAMRSKDKVALDTLRAVKSQIILLKTSGKEEVFTSDDEIALIQRLVKQRKESATMFETSGRKELAENELAQIKVLEQFLPKQLTSEELTEELKVIIKELDISSIKEIGKLMGIASKKLAGKADGKSISETAKKLLS